MTDTSNLLFAESHEWIKIDNNEGLVGISDFAQKALGDVTFIDLPTIGAKLEAGKIFGSIESVKAASDLYSPVDGEVIAVNEALEAAPEIINQSPYADGWILRVKVAENPSKLMNADAYKAFIANEH